MKTFFSLLVTLIALSLPVRGSAEPRTIRILHVNDFHGFAHPVQAPDMAQPLGGAARLAHRIAQLRSERPSLLLAAGDMIQGDSWANLNSGAAVIEFMNLLRFDALVTGNHEYDFGRETLEKRISEAVFPVLAANVSGVKGVQPVTVITRNGLRIAVVGLVTDDTPETSHPRNTRNLHFAKPLERAMELVRELRGKADLIVLLTHIGHAADRELAQSLSGPLSAAPHHSMRMGNLLIVGGHSHTRVEHPVRIGSNYVAQAWEHGKTLGVIDVVVDGGAIVSLEGHLEEITAAGGVGDPQVADLVKRYDERSTALLSAVVGTAAVDLVQEGVRRQETNLGNLVADVVRDTTKADVAIVNGGSIRSGISRGPVTMKDVYATLPFDNYLVAVRMSGAQLRDTLEHGVSAVERGEGRFPQVSGLSFAFDPSRSAGQRVVRVELGGKPLDPNREYVVATLDFIAAGGDGYRAFGAAIRSAGDFSDTGGALHSSRLAYNDPGRWLRDIVADYLRTHAALAPALEGRIRKVR